MMEATEPCLICYRRARNRGQQGYHPTQENLSGSTKRKEKLKRFFNLLGRHLDQNASTDGKEEAALENLINAGILSCEDCSKVVESFCDLYHQMKSIELLLNWKVRSLENIMSSAQRVPVRMKEFKSCVKMLDISGGANKRASGDKAVQFIFNFKWELIQKCKEKLRATFPILKLNKHQSQQKVVEKSPNFPDFSEAVSRIFEINAAAPVDTCLPRHAFDPVSTGRADDGGGSPYESILPDVSIVKSEPESDTLQDSAEAASSRLRQVYRCSKCRKTFSEFRKLEEHQWSHADDNDDWVWPNDDSTKGAAGDENEDVASNFDSGDDAVNEGRDCLDDSDMSDVDSENDVDEVKMSEEKKTKSQIRNIILARKLRKSRVSATKSANEIAKQHISFNPTTGQHNCCLCDKEFASQGSVFRHYRDRHLGIKPYKCKFCNHRSAHKHALTLHLKGVHNLNTLEAREAIRKYNRISEFTADQCIDDSQQSPVSADTEANIPVDPANVAPPKTYPAAILPPSTTSRKCQQFFRLSEMHCTFNPKTKKHKCNVCDREFSQRCKFFLHHRDVHLRIKPFKCPICDQGFVQRSLMAAHMKKAHPNTIKKVQKETNYAITSVTATNPEPVTNAVTMENSTGEVKNGSVPPSGIHQLLYTFNPETEMYQCKLCKRELNTRCNFFRHHRNVHMKVRPYKCKVCGETFRWKLYFQKHLNQSATCAATQSLKTDFRSSPLYRCYVCGKSFTKLYILKSHLKSHSTNPVVEESSADIIVTEACLPKSSPVQKIPSGDLLQQGIIDQYPNSFNPDTGMYKCKLCKTELNSRCNLFRHHRNVHLKVRPYKCQVCGETFRWKQYFQKHLNQSTTCAATQSLKTDFRRSGARCYRCYVCGKSFNKLYYLKSHLISHSSNPVVEESSEGMVAEACIPKSVQIPSGDRDLRKQRLIEQYPSSFNPETGMYKCKLCEQEVNSRGTLFRHHRNVHLKIRPYKCQVCGETFRWKPYFQKHLQLSSTCAATQPLQTDFRRSGSRCYRCYVCGNGFTKLYYLKSHLKSHSSNPIVKDDIADLPDGMEDLKQPSTSEDNIESAGRSPSHQVSRTRRPRKLFGFKSQFNPETGKYKCPDCPKECRSDKLVKSHYAYKHLKRVPIPQKWKCNLCGKELSHKSTYNVHMENFHQGVRYKCQKCKYPFVQRCGLKLHLRTTSCGEGEEAKPPVLHKCQFCEKEFYPRARLEYHVKSVHQTEREREHLCSECGKDFMTMRGLKIHMETVHSESTVELLCDLCGRKFKHKSSLVKHRHTCHNQRSRSSKVCKTSV